MKISISSHTGLSVRKLERSYGRNKRTNDTLLVGALRVKELHSRKRELWLWEIQKYLPDRQELQILDIGTGTGFFCFLLGGLGHHMTGIDLTEEMILEARETSRTLGIPADFRVMDAESPDLGNHCFDAVISRNLTWTLPHLGEAYRNWRELLKPGGVLINFDADYCREDRSAPLPANHAHRDISAAKMREYEQMKDMLRPFQEPRPRWDEKLLREAGFQNIETDTGVWKRVYGDYDEFYNPTPIFTIKATA